MRDFKVVLCSINSKYIHSSLAPWCIYTSAKTRCSDGIILNVTEGTVNENEDTLLERILSRSPDAVAFSCYIWNIKTILRLSERIKSNRSDVIIILGGPEVSYRPAELLEGKSFVDYLLTGEGEVAVPELLNCIYSGRDVDIPSVSYRTADGLHIDLRAAYTDEGVSPYCEEYFSTLNGRIAYIESSRGCPFGCAFCLSGRLGKVRYIDIDRVKKEMLSLAKAGAKTVKFVDRTFNCNKSRAKEILTFISELYGKAIPEGTCFHFEIAADLLDGELFEVISALPQGAVQFEIGIQSFNEATLKAINRKTDINKVTANIERLVSFGNCHIHIDLIAGLPEEGYESFVEGFNRAYRLKANMLQLGFLKILHGTPMAENRAAFPCEYSSEPPYQVTETPWITKEELRKLQLAENELDRLYNSGRFSRTLDCVLSESGIEPFELFYGLGDYLLKTEKKGSMPLDEYTNTVYDYFSSLELVSAERLRDAMIYDRISTNNSGVIPERLKVVDPNMKKIRNCIRETDPVKNGVDRTVAVLYTENKAIYCDYESRNPVTGKYDVMEYPLERE
ncbi:MAG: DUF4080 domain-containing protein [Clostridia bacterium]|nr:DUF4080 domain-containing protein [Clostridia bacterium]